LINPCFQNGGGVRVTAVFLFERVSAMRTPQHRAGKTGGNLVTRDAGNSRDDFPHNLWQLF